jgi:hypothetical protein
MRPRFLKEDLLFVGISSSTLIFKAFLANLAIIGNLDLGCPEYVDCDSINDLMDSPLIEDVHSSLHGRL